MKNEIRYTVTEDYTGAFRIASVTGTVRGKTVKLHSASLDFAQCRTVISIAQWNQWAKDKQEAIQQKLKQMYDQHESYNRRCEQILKDMRRLNAETERLLK